MLHFNLWLTLVVVVLSVLMVLVGKTMLYHSRKYFSKQQKSIGKLNGYIEEIFGGLKVVKVFCHEDATREQFRKVNEELCGNSMKAGGISIVMMPIMSGFGNLQYLAVAILGGAMALFGSGTFTTTIGTLVSFLGVIRQFSSSITQVAQQMNSVALGLAGAGRIFDLMDQEPEEDEGYLLHYDAYINSLVMYDEIGPDGQLHSYIDEDMKIQVQMKIVDALQNKWRKLI